MRLTLVEGSCLSSQVPLTIPKLGLLHKYKLSWNGTPQIQVLGKFDPGGGGVGLTDAAGVYAYFSSDRSGARPNDDVIVTSGMHVSCGCLT